MNNLELVVASDLAGITRVNGVCPTDPEHILQHLKTLIGNSPVILGAETFTALNDYIKFPNTIVHGNAHIPSGYNVIGTVSDLADYDMVIASTGLEDAIVYILGFDWHYYALSEKINVLHHYEQFTKYKFDTYDAIESLEPRFKVGDWKIKDSALLPRPTPSEKAVTYKRKVLTTS